MLRDGEFSTIISALGPLAQRSQLPWIDAASQAGITRFIPCGFTTICPRGGIMAIRDEKEEIHDAMFRMKLPFTIVDVGYWHQLSVPWLASGRLDKASAGMAQRELCGNGSAKTLLIDKRDIGRFVARIVKDERTINRRVVCYAEELSQREVWDVAERVSGEGVPRRLVRLISPSQNQLYLSGAMLIRVCAARSQQKKSRPGYKLQKRPRYLGIS
jgi:hypothetical protein